ncbi:phosphoribosylaminoimidazolesuccinocarboxamide synthase [Pseudomonas aeruginosa]
MPACCLVDFKLEFGLFAWPDRPSATSSARTQALVCGDKETRKKMDKDRFRQGGLGDVIEAYEEVVKRLGVPL